MARPNLVVVLGVSLACFLGSVKIVYAQAHLASGHFTGAHFGTPSSSSSSPDPCAGKSIGQACTDGAIYAGTGYSAGGLNSALRYEVTPGGCTDYTNNSTAFSPTCAGGTDTVTHAWANGSGTTAYGVSTGATDNNNGNSNTSTLAANYTDTDAARYCHYMNYAGHTDWYLPSLDELSTVLSNNSAALGGFALADYWPSTEASTTTADSVPFSLGSPTNDKKNTETVRCVRSY